MNHKSYDPFSNKGSRSYLTKAAKPSEHEGVSVHHSTDKERLNINVDHAPGKDNRDKAIKKAHAIAEEHGHDTDGADISTHGYGDRHTTSCTYCKKP